MLSSIELFLNRLDGLVCGQPEYYLVTPRDVRPPLWSIIYRDFPMDGGITAFTYGLSSVDHPDWQAGKPELVLSVASGSLDWGLAIGHLALSMRGEHPFSYGSIIDFGERIAEDSQMTGFLVFSPTVLPLEACRIELPDRTINLVQLYPLYRQEIELLQEADPADFFLREDLDLYSVDRPAMNGSQPDGPK
jgi:hypothetical protein